MSETEDTISLVDHLVLVLILVLILTHFRGSRPEVFFKKGVLRNFAELTGKHLCQRLFFNKVVGLKPATLLKKRLWHKCFPVNFANFLKTTFLEYTSGGCFYHLKFFDKLKPYHLEQTVSDNENTGGEVRPSTMQTKELKKN